MIIEGRLVHEQATLDGAISGVMVELWHRRSIPLRSFLGSN